MKPGETKAEIHAKLCTDETIHYPDLHRAGKITQRTVRYVEGYPHSR